MYSILINMNKLVPISEASKLLGVSVPTLRRWEAEGRLIPEHTAGKHRRYDLLKLKPWKNRKHDH